MPWGSTMEGEQVNAGQVNALFFSTLSFPWRRFLGNFYKLESNLFITKWFAKISFQPRLCSKWNEELKILPRCVCVCVCVLVLRMYSPPRSSWGGDQGMLSGSLGPPPFLISSFFKLPIFLPPCVLWVGLTHSSVSKPSLVRVVGAPACMWPWCLSHSLSDFCGILLHCSPFSHHSLIALSP